MAKVWSCHECGEKMANPATLCIYEEKTGPFKDFCFD